MNIFNDKSQVSWRKILTALGGLLFLVACLGWLIVNKFAELPGSYLSIIVLVFTFYFFKDTLRNVKLINKKEDGKE